ncbi:MAG: HAD-IA family hydrolase [Firmicutes bacterium]|nr:HAD-IA family hydrolase [Bacillota bacterium]
MASPLRAVLLDLDGTLIDSAGLIVASFRHAFREVLGEDLAPEEVIRHLGRSLNDQIRIMRPHLDTDQARRLMSVYLEHNHRTHDAGGLQPVPGSVPALERLQAQGLELAIVTSKREAMAWRGLELTGLDRFFRAPGRVVAYEATRRHKPHPEPLWRALATLGLEPGEAVYVGDSPFDMAAARAAGIPALGFRYNTFTEADLQAAGALTVAGSWPAVVAWVDAARAGDGREEAATWDSTEQP